MFEGEGDGWQTDQEKAALRSLFELKDKTGSAVDLYFGPRS
jgi:hypothetical protein